MLPKYRNPKWLLPSLILGGFEFFVCFSCLCYSIHIRRQHAAASRASRKNLSAASPSLKYIHLCGIICFLVCSIVHSVNAWYWNIEYDHYSFIQTMTWYIAWLFWSTGIFMTYLLFLHRIRVTFKNSSLQPSRCTLHILYILLTLYFVLFLGSNILPIFLYEKIGGFTINRREMYRIEFIVVVGIALLEVIISLSMTGIFVLRLYSLILMQTVHHYDEGWK